MDIRLFCFGIFLLLMLGAIVSMLVSLGREGDERRRMIVEKAGTGAFATLGLYLLFTAVKSTARSFLQGGPVEKLDPVVMLMVAAVIYGVHLLYFKKKYGG